MGSPLLLYELNLLCEALTPMSIEDSLAQALRKKIANYGKREGFWMEFSFDREERERIDGKLTVPILGIQVPGDDLVPQAPHGVEHATALSTIRGSKPLGTNTDDLLESGLETSDLIA